VVDVRVAQDDRLDAACLEWRLAPVPLAEFLQTLEQAAVKQNVVIIGADEVL
jgi:hypothetical protein